MKYAGDRPRTFKHDISKEVETLELDAEHSARAGKDLWKRAFGQVKNANKQDETARFFQGVTEATTNKMYLPSKDLTHLLVFDSKSSEMRFRELLSSRTPVGNFIMEGSIDAARLFNTSIKRGTPVFVMQGSGGASDKLSLVLEHMKWRKQLDADGDEVKYSDFHLHLLSV